MSSSSTTIDIPSSSNNHRDDDSAVLQQKIPQTAQGKPTIPLGYSYIPTKPFAGNSSSSGNNNSNGILSKNAVIILVALLGTCSLCLFILAAALWTHPAWNKAIAKRFPNSLVNRNKNKQAAGTNNVEITPLSEEFQLHLPPNFDVTKKMSSPQKHVPWLPTFRKAKSGVEKIRLPDGSFRQISWSVVSESKPRALLINGTLLPQEADTLIAAARKSLERSKVIAGNAGENEENTVRTSSGMFLLSEEERSLPANKNLRTIVAAMGGIPQDDWIEATQILEYKVGQRYVPHPDYYSPGDVANLQRGGQRIYTVITWLNDVKEGGETTFPNAQIKIKSHPFNSLLFYDATEDNQPDFYSIHSGEPPGEGSWKMICVNWCHGMPFW
jgi:prolyl 4-hydroxylase